MPFQKNGKRQYDREWEWEKKRKPKRLRDRVKRVQARRKMEAEGKVRPGQHVDHIQHLSAGGSNAMSNLRAISAQANLQREARRKQRLSR